MLRDSHAQHLNLKPHQSQKSDPDLKQNQKSDPDLNQSRKSDPGLNQSKLSDTGLNQRKMLDPGLNKSLKSLISLGISIKVIFYHPLRYPEEI